MRTALLTRPQAPMRALLPSVLGLVVALGAWPAAGAPPKDAAAGRVGPAAAAPALPAQLGGDVGAIPLGSWAEYAVADLRRKATLRLRLAVVERSDSGTWTELTLHLPGTERLIIKTLIKGDSRHPASVKRVILKAGNLQAVEIVGGPPAEAAPRYQSAASGTAKKLGTETVRVPAGAVLAEHHRFTGREEVADSWTSGKIPLFGLVKLKSKDFIMELAASGLDARSQISGRVGKLDLQALKGQGPGSQPAK